MKPSENLSVAIVAEEPDGDGEPRHQIGRTFITAPLIELPTLDDLLEPFLPNDFL